MKRIRKNKIDEKNVTEEQFKASVKEIANVSGSQILVIRYLIEKMLCLQEEVEKIKKKMEVN